MQGGRVAYRILTGDCVLVMRAMDEASIDAIVCDPPYGLEFMGKEWDGANGFRRALNVHDVQRSNVFGRTSQTSPEYITGKTWEKGGGFSKPGIGERETPWPSHSSTSRFGQTNPTCGTCGGRLRGARKCACDEPQWKPIGPRKTDEDIPDGLTGGGYRNDLHVFQAWTAQWAHEAYRVLKPGGHVLAFGGTRTYHRMACAIEDAGFEIRDSLHWIYGSGFPKSHNISKALDKAAGATRPVVGARVNADGRVRTLEPSGGGQRVALHGGGIVERTEIVTAPATDEAHQWDGWGTALKPAHEPIVMARKPLIGTVAANVVRYGTGAINVDGCRIGTSDTLHGGAGVLWSHQRDGTQPRIIPSDAQGRWPANVLLSHHPECDHECHPDCAVAELDQCSNGASRFFYVAKASRRERSLGIDTIEIVTLQLNQNECSGDTLWDNEDQRVRLQVDTAMSPPRVIGVSTIPRNDESVWNTMLYGKDITDLFPKGNRFTIVTKINSTTASKTLSYLTHYLINESIVAASIETESNTSHAENAESTSPSLTITNDATVYLPGVGPVVSQTRWTIKGNDGSFADHPTVKPVDLMRYLCRLVTPPGGTVLDPFAGSGSTGVAALREGLTFLGIEQDEHYSGIAQRRCAYAAAQGADKDITHAELSATSRRRMAPHAGHTVRGDDHEPMARQAAYDLCTGRDVESHQPELPGAS